jgi:hypothetical protein
MLSRSYGLARSTITVSSNSNATVIEIQNRRLLVFYSAGLRNAAATLLGWFNRLILLLERQRPFPVSVANTKCMPLLQIVGPCQIFFRLLGPRLGAVWKFLGNSHTGEAQSRGPTQLSRPKLARQKPNTEIWAGVVPRAPYTQANCTNIIWTIH